jgi:hypothetical protein
MCAVYGLYGTRCASPLPANWNSLSSDWPGAISTLRTTKCATMPRGTGVQWKEALPSICLAKGAGW